MGLDMYLDRFDRYKHATPRDILAVEDWMRYQTRDQKYLDTSFYEWCHKDKPSDDFIQYYGARYIDRHPYWAFMDNYMYKSCSENIGYWRKANQIHEWFVDNVQDGADDCDYHREVTEDDLKSLLETCQKVLDCPTLAEELLPTTSGYFFGGMDYDEYYIEDIKETIKIIENALQTTDFATQMIYYCSSW